MAGGDGGTAGADAAATLESMQGDLHSLDAHVGLMQGRALDVGEEGADRAIQTTIRRVAAEVQRPERGGAGSPEQRLERVRYRLAELGRHVDALTEYVAAVGPDKVDGLLRERIEMVAGDRERLDRIVREAQ